MSLNFGGTNFRANSISRMGRTKTNFRGELNFGDALRILISRTKFRGWIKIKEINFEIGSNNG